MEFIEFKGHNILYKRINGVYWIALKPLCEALGVNYNRQYQNAMSHPIFGPAFAVQQMQVPGDQARNMICLPEEYIYGWLFSINSDSPELLLYQKECNHILYNHFHGVITRRSELYTALADKRHRIEQLQTSLSQNPEFVEWNDARMTASRLWKDIKGSVTQESELFKDEDFQ